MEMEKTRTLIGDKAFYKRTFAVAIPIMIQNVITNFVNLLDNLMVGQVGTEQMSGVAIVNQFNFIMALAVFGGLAGAGILLAQFCGKGDMEGIKSTFRAKIWIVLIIWVASWGIVLSYQDALISLFLHESDTSLSIDKTMQYAKQYLHVIIWQFPPFIFSQVYATTLRETGETGLPMKAGIAAVCINVIFNWILIFGKLGAPKLGVVGAAVATVMARCAECAIIVLWTHKHKEKNPYIKGLWSSLAVPRKIAKQVFTLGLPLLINELLWSTGMTALSQAYSLRGIEVVSAENIAMTIGNLFFCLSLAMGSTISIIIGQLLGAGELERARTEDRWLIAFSVSLSTAVAIVMAFVSPYIPALYNTIDEVKKLAVTMLMINAVCMIPNTLSNACYFTLRAGGNTLITFLFDSVFVWVVCVPLAHGLARYTAMPIIPLYMAVRGAEALKALMGYIFLKRGTWVNNLVEDL